MKKSIVAVALTAVLMITLSSCSYYSCATYAKKQPKEKPSDKSDLRYL